MLLVCVNEVGLSSEEWLIPTGPCIEKVLSLEHFLLHTKLLHLYCSIQNFKQHPSFTQLVYSCQELNPIE